MHNCIIELVNKHLYLLNDVEYVYIFGSILDSNKMPNDIDIFIVYFEYTDILQKQINEFVSSLETASKLRVDLTVLSFDEEKQVHFLEKIKYIQLK